LDVVKPKPCARHFTITEGHVRLDNNTRYQELIEKESKHWGSVRPDPRNPQIWQDAELFEIFFGPEYRRFIEQAGTSGPAVLELGCGEGHLTLELARRGHRVTAIDLSAERIERAQAKARDIGKEAQITFVVADLNIASLPSAAYDCVVAHDSLHHIFDLKHLCDEVFKSLKPNGRFLVMDFVGMGPARRIFAAALYALLPTYQSYREKWRLRHQLPRFLASEAKKQQSLEAGTTSALHHDSPFEEISQRSIVQEIARRFLLDRYVSFCPFWYYFAAKVRLPRRLKYPMARCLRTMDNAMLTLHLARGAYVSLEARKH
jgi:ubiquinone/menaquinone biosynthesis C-methylase UbiE